MDWQWVFFFVLVAACVVAGLLLTPKTGQQEAPDPPDVWSAIQSMTYDPLGEAGDGATLHGGKGDLPEWYSAIEHALEIPVLRDFLLEESEEME